jgi:hypothetical protein
MDTSPKTRALALIASILVTTTLVTVIASYAHPQQRAPMLAQAMPRG